MKLGSFLPVFFVLVLLGCGSTSKTITPNLQSKQVDDMVRQNSFEIQSDWAIPLMTNSLNQVSNAGLFPPGSSANRISLIGNSNYLRIQGREVEAYLPYFGERHSGAGYGSSDHGIQFQGIPNTYEVIRDENTLRHKINFKIRHESEAYDVRIILYPNLKSEIHVNSSQRFAIRYTGRVKNTDVEQ